MPYFFYSVFYSGKVASSHENRALVGQIFGSKSAIPISRHGASNTVPFREVRVESIHKRTKQAPVTRTWGSR